jgi:hypothetical protein
VNVFERALEIIDTRGWWQGDEHGPNGERCLMQALNEASRELRPWTEKWHYRLPFGEGRRLRALLPHRALADDDLAMLHAAIAEVTGKPLWGCTAQWNDEQATEEDVRLALKIAARAVEEAS